MYIAKAKSFESTQIFLLYLVMLPQFIAKHVFGMEEFLYINDKNSVIKDVASASDLSFETSTKPRFVEFYSPYCVCGLSQRRRVLNKKKYLYLTHKYIFIVYFVLISVHSGSLHSFQKEIRRSCQRSL
jgi:type IV secretory pathway VirB6-like protein